MSFDPDSDRLLTQEIPVQPEFVWVFRPFDPVAKVRAFRDETTAREYATEHGGKLNQVRVE